MSQAPLDVGGPGGPAWALGLATLQKTHQGAGKVSDLQLHWEENQRKLPASKHLSGDGAPAFLSPLVVMAQSPWLRGTL